MKISNYTLVTNDSRKVIPGSLFIAVRGFASDGHDFIQSAIDNGAAAIVYEDSSKLPGLNAAEKEGKVELFKVDNSRKAVAELADEYYGHPSRKLKLAGITGTNGKTTTVTLLYNLFTGMGYKCGLLSTIANYVVGERYEAVNTTSDPFTINALMAEMVEKGCEYCFMEVSSIGVEQERVHGLNFNAGIFSNLTHDHLDYHKTFSEYLRCKKLFFDRLGSEAFAITNIDDRNGLVMVQNTKSKVITYSCRKDADHCCRIMEESFDGMLLKIDGTDVWVPLIGQHNAYNVLAIYSTALALGASKEDCLTGLSKIGQVCGRLEQMRASNGMSVVIDYAHTPDAMENVLKTLREIAPERELVCLFGCGGDRDKAKRPEMAAVAGKMADKIIITSDNSRSEKTSDIIADIKAGLDGAALARTICIEDRKEAIRTAIITGKNDSTILLAGKGHEDYQIFGKVKNHFDEHEIVAETFKELNL